MRNRYDRRREKPSVRILMIGPDRSVHGGISGVVNNYYEAGLDKRIDLCYVGTMVEGSRVRKLFTAIKAYFRFLFKLSAYRLVHVNMASDSSYFRKSVFIRTARLFGKKIVIHQHGGDFENFYYHQLSERGRKNLRRVLSMGDAFVVISPSLEEFFGGLLGRERLTLLPNAIQIPPQGGKEYGRHRILFLGRICREKGIRELLSVMPALKEKYPDIRLCLGGVFEDPQLKEKVEALSDCVEWIGWVGGEEKERYLREFDIFVLPSYFEGQPVSVLEAMAYSCAVVASGTGGIPQMIIDNETGILVEPKSGKSLREGLERALSDNKLCERLGKSAREKAQREFSLDQNMERLLEIYRSVLE